MVKEFRTRNRDAAKRALDHLLYHYVRRAPNQEALRQLYLDARGLNKDPHRNFELRSTDQVAEEWDYWRRLIEVIRGNNRFNENQAQQKRDYFSYWAGQLDGRFDTHDEYQIARMEFHRNATGNSDKWRNDMMAYYRDNQAGKGNGRTAIYGSDARQRPAVRALFNELGGTR